MSLTTAQMEQITAQGLASRIVSQYVKPVPTISSNASQSIIENELAVAAVNVLSARFDAVFTHSIDGGADAVFFTIDPNTGVPSFLVAPDYEDPQDANGDNVYEVTVRATDQYGASTTKALQVTVTNITNVGTLTNTDESGVELASSAAAGTPVTGVTWSHNLGDAAVYYLTDNAGGRFTINAVTGQIQRSGSGTLGASHTVTVRAEPVDGGEEELYAQADVTITVTSDAVPIIISNGGGATASFTITEGETAVTTVVADGQPIKYSITGGADQAFFSIDADTGVLTFNSAPDYSSPQDAGADNTYIVEVTASDGVRSDVQTITATVTGQSGIGSVPGTEINMRTGTSSTGTTWADASATHGQSATGTYWWELQHDGSTEGYLFTSKLNAYTGLAETYFVAMEVKSLAGEDVEPSMNISSGPFPAADITTNPASPTISAGTGGVRADGLGQFTVWMELPSGATLQNLYLHMANNGDLSPSGADALSGQGYLIGAIWLEAKGANSEPTAVVA